MGHMLLIAGAHTQEKHLHSSFQSLRQGRISQKFGCVSPLKLGPPPHIRLGPSQMNLMGGLMDHGLSGAT